jgi:hypothetical protein
MSEITGKEAVRAWYTERISAAQTCVFRGRKVVPPPCKGMAIHGPTDRGGFYWIPASYLGEVEPNFPAIPVVFLGVAATEGGGDE